MIIKGGARSSGGFFAHHLMKAEDNERVDVTEIRGLLADNVRDALQEMRMVAAGTKADNYFYHASINPREDEHLTPEQWEVAVDRLEQNLGLTDHARFQVEHEKEGRIHRHIVWSRVDLESMTVTPASGNYLAHDKTRAELEREFSHEPTPPTPEPSQRKSREFAEWENWRGTESGISPAEMKAEITALWQQSDGGRAFSAAIEEKGYLLAKGDRRDFVLIDSEGDIHSLARRIDGAKAADIRAKMTDLDRDSLMTAQEASAWMKGKDEAENSGSSDARILPEEQATQDPRAAWFAANMPAEYPQAATLHEYSNQLETEMKARDCELPFSKGRTWEILAEQATKFYRERAQSVTEKAQELTHHLSDKLHQSKEKISSFWQDFIKEGRERQPPETPEPDLER